MHPVTRVRSLLGVSALSAEDKPFLCGLWHPEAVEDAEDGPHKKSTEHCGLGRYGAVLAQFCQRGGDVFRVA
jgi:hypothetical protein